jgi:hypothetical protein
VPVPRPGATVFVPERGESMIGTNFSSIVSVIAQVLGVVATALVVANQM